MTDLISNPDFIAAYDEAIAALEGTPGDKALAHAAVLALARSGATDFAAHEYQRLGLDRISDDEDMLALAARLAKDRALQTQDKRDPKTAFAASARLYRKAHIASGGSYSLINALTLEKLSGELSGTWHQEVRSLLSRLDAETQTAPLDAYYAEATRAEAYLLLDEPALAGLHLHAAFAHDPLNYPAHATTLKQFNLIETSAGRDTNWLTPFSPPDSVHVCGHMFSDEHVAILNGQGLPTKIADKLQEHDLAFGFGALAAGSDLLLAEAILSEGGQFYAVLPVDVERFEAVSVTPYGAGMQARFRKALERCSDVYIAFPEAPWPDATLNRITAQIAMGKARLHAKRLQSRSLQMALIDPVSSEPSATQSHIQDWCGTGGHSLELEVPNLRKGGRVGFEASGELSAACYEVDGAVVARSRTISELVQSALDELYDDKGADGLFITETAAQAGHFVPRTLTLSENCAALLAFERPDAFDITYSGRSKDAQRIFVVTRQPAPNRSE